MAKKSGGFESVLVILSVIIFAVLVLPKLLKSASTALGAKAPGSSSQQSSAADPGFAAALKSLGNQIMQALAKATGSAGKIGGGGNAPGASPNSLLGKAGTPLFASPAAQQKFIQAAGGGQGPQVSTSPITGSIPYQVDASVSPSDLRWWEKIADPQFSLTDIFTSAVGTPSGSGTVSDAFSSILDTSPSFNLAAADISGLGFGDAGNAISDWFGSGSDLAAPSVDSADIGSSGDLWGTISDWFGFDSGPSFDSSYQDSGSYDNSAPAYSPMDFSGYDYADVIDSYTADGGDQVFYY